MPLPAYDGLNIDTVETQALQFGEPAHRSLPPVPLFETPALDDEMPRLDHETQTEHIDSQAEPLTPETSAPKPDVESDPIGTQLDDRPVVPQISKWHLLCVFLSPTQNEI